MATKSKDGLNLRQALFVLEYLVDLNATAAARRAGYTGSDETLAVTGHELLKHPKIAAAVQSAMDARSNRVKLSADDVLREILLIAKADLANAYDDNGKLLPIRQIPEETRRAWAGVKVFEEFDGVGKDRVKVGETKEVKFWPKPQALEMLGRHLKLFTDKIEIHDKTSLADKLARARKRNAG